MIESQFMKKMQESNKKVDLYFTLCLMVDYLEQKGLINTDDFIDFIESRELAEGLVDPVKLAEPISDDDWDLL